MGAGRAGSIRVLPLPAEATGRRNDRTGSPYTLERASWSAWTSAPETKRLFANRKLAQSETELWEMLVFGALGMSGLAATAFSLLAW